MKIKEGFLLKKIADNHVVVPVGSNVIDFSIMLTLNETGVFLWEKLQKDITKAELTDALLSEYDVDRETAEKDISEFVEKLAEKKVLCD